MESDSKRKVCQVKTIYDAVSAIAQGATFIDVCFGLELSELSAHELNCARNYVYGAFSQALMMQRTACDSKVCKELEMLYEHLFEMCSQRLDAILNGRIVEGTVHA